MSFYKQSLKEQQLRKTQGYLKTFGAKFNAKNVSNQVRKFGSFLAGMIMPAIGVFIAWGLFTAFFIKTGWIPNEALAKIVGPTLVYIIPSLIAFFGGKQIYGIRGGILAVFVTMGIIIGGQSSYFNKIAGISEANASSFQAPMILGAMITAPITALIFKNLEKLWTNKIPQGFEMLVNNFSIGIFGFLGAIAVYFGFTPIVAGVQYAFTFIIKSLSDNNLNWLLPIFVEPVKVIFLNNAINHGIFTPLGQTEVVQHGRSFLLLLDPNPGQGLGLLTAFYLFGKSREMKAQALSAMPIHFIGGIHEVYFPFVLAKPITVLFMMVGGIFNTFIYEVFSVGSIGINSPGSVISVYTFIAKDSYLGLTISVFGSAAIVAFLTSTYLIYDRKKNGERVFVNWNLAYLNGLYEKAINLKNLNEINEITPLKSLEYKNISTNKKYKIEIVKFADGTEKIYILNLKTAEIIYFDYLSYKNKKYLIRVYQNNRNNQFYKWLTQMKLLLPKTKYKFLYENTSKKLKMHSNFHFTYSKLMDSENNNLITNISYENKILIKKYRIYSFLKITRQQTKKIVTKKELLPMNAIEINLEQLQASKKISIISHLSEDEVHKFKNCKKIVFACEAGMGSSAMGSSLVKKMLRENDIQDIVVINKAFRDLSKNDEFIIAQKAFKDVVTKSNPNSHFYFITNFLVKKDYEKLIKDIIFAKKS